MRFLKCLGSSVLFSSAVASISLSPAYSKPFEDSLAVNDKEYLEMRGLNVMLAHDFYPEGHQAGVSVIQNGVRAASNGNIGISAVHGQWVASPKVGKRVVDAKNGELSVDMHYPDETKSGKGYNPIDYPDLKLDYVIHVKAEGRAFRVVVDLDKPLPPEWAGKVDFSIELFPAILFGKSYAIGGANGVFPRQCDPSRTIDYGGDKVVSYGAGRSLVVAGECDSRRMTIEAVRGGELSLQDERYSQSNGWFVVCAHVPTGVAKGAIEWLVTPNAIPGWTATPTIQYSQVGYHLDEAKSVVIELDRHDAARPPVVLYRAGPGGFEKVLERPAEEWGDFLRSHYLKFDFSDVKTPGIYEIEYNGVRSGTFPIDANVFEKGVWQPSVATFLPVQMCHVAVMDGFRAWHGACHLDDAVMAPTDHNHFDGYAQGPSTLCKFKPGEHVPGLDVGGWHDAGDLDLRLESQATTVYGLALAYELFHPVLDDTAVDRAHRIVYLHRPDGKPDILQQIEHGVLSIVAGYKSLGRFYRGIQDADLNQYVFIGDTGTVTDGKVFNDDAKGTAFVHLAETSAKGREADPESIGLPPFGCEGAPDDRWVFTVDNPMNEMIAAGSLAAAARVLKGYDDALADDCLKIAVEVWNNDKVPDDSGFRIMPAIELFLTTGDKRYAQAIPATEKEVEGEMMFLGWLGARSLSIVDDAGYRARMREALVKYGAETDRVCALNPYDVPFGPGSKPWFDEEVWGEGWDVIDFGFAQYFLHEAAPDIFSSDRMLHALEFELGRHPGSNNASLVSGVGAKSVTAAYGVNRADFSYIPGGTVSGPAFIRPDFTELAADWPFFWQQTEYCVGSSTSSYVFLVLAADKLLSEEAAK